ncbi:MAG: DUF1499 domain-containing protein [Candidatus Lokiarchaeota archaeon]|nr:DUF1499 domain-containing protein [Candidatus Lokiarchaeota archaeon]
MMLITKKPKNIGITNGKFHPCPSSPNCVSTQSIDEKHKMDPINFEGSLEEARSKIINIIKSLKRSKIIVETEKYLHIEFRTAVWRFVDDVEFYFDETEKEIHFRSAARLGYSDMGVNKKRMENITISFMNS